MENTFSFHNANFACSNKSVYSFISRPPLAMSFYVKNKKQKADYKLFPKE